MAQIEVKLPKMGESVAEATITTWLKQVGEEIEEEESLVEIATDKVDSEVPSPVSGVIQEIFFNEGDVAQVGDVIATISGEGDESNSDAEPEKTIDTSVPVESETIETNLLSETNNGSATGDEIQRNSNGKFFSPLVRSIAQKEGIAQAELEQITGTGLNDRVTKKDILNYLSGPRVQATTTVQSETKVDQAQAKVTAPVQADPTSIPKPEDFSGNVEIEEMDRMRKLIARHMVNSMSTSPHVTSYVEADVTSIVQWRNKVKTEFQKREGEKLTYTPIFIEAVIKAIKDFPMVNVSLQGDYIIKKKDVNVGMATALPSGNLIVPVIHHADQLNLMGLAKRVNDLATRARNNELNPDEIANGTYTVTNVGTFGNVMGTPIINQPQVAILALGSIRKVPAVIETPDGDFIGIRHKMYLSHSYDHRIVDGALGGMFVRRVADYLESFDVNREI
ncbi:MAG TPA: diapophytoene dehydrogenase [Flavobacteriales bacterium]|jgi:2-oxoglutarate dehydrogenase E2 component (dihydrolipoamide succinyltransferase)|nr:diapophytoene dehydrogenase [Flavobacteriales bacterium]